MKSYYNNSLFVKAFVIYFTFFAFLTIPYQGFKRKDRKSLEEGADDIFVQNTKKLLQSLLLCGE